MLALLLLENSWDKWSARIADADNIQLPSTKYSHDGSVAAAMAYHGWKASGMTRFTELHNMVTADRATDRRKRFEEDFLSRKQESSNNNNNKRRKITYHGQMSMPTIPNDLGDDLEMQQAAV